MLWFLPGLASAQTAPPSWNTPYDSGRSLQDAKPPPAPKPEAPEQAPEVIRKGGGAEAPARERKEPKAEERTPPAAASGPEPTLLVKAFRVLGAAHVPADEIRAVLAPYKGRRLTLARIEAAAGKVTTLFRERGYVVARVYVPKQDASDGTLTLQVVIGKYGAVTLKNDSLVVDAMLKPLLEDLSEDRPVRLGDLEQSMLLISDLPGAELPRLTISPGAEAGTSDFMVEVPRPPTGRVALVGDNMGSLYTGEYRLSGFAELNSPLGFGDKLSLNLLGTDAGQLTSLRAAYNVPLALNGLRGEIAAGQTTYDVGGDFAATGAKGRARQLEGSLTFPLVRTRKRNFYLAVSGAYRSFRDETNVGGREVRIRKAAVGSFSPRYEEWAALGALPLYVSASASFTLGNISWTQNRPYTCVRDPAYEGPSEDSSSEEPSARPAGACRPILDAETSELTPTVQQHVVPAGAYSHLSASIFTQLELAPTWLFSVTARVQHILTSQGGLGLDPSEQFLVTGPFGVRSYRATITGDNAYVVSGQLSYVLWVPTGFESKLSHALTVFADVGGYGLENGTSQMCQKEVEGSLVTWSPGTRHLRDVGAGYNARFKSLFGSVQLAGALGQRSCLSEQESRNRVLVQLGLSI